MRESGPHVASFLRLRKLACHPLEASQARTIGTMRNALDEPTGPSAPSCSPPHVLGRSGMQDPQERTDNPFALITRNEANSPWWQARLRRRLWQVWIPTVTPRSTSVPYCGELRDSMGRTGVTGPSPDGGRTRTVAEQPGAHPLAGCAWQAAARTAMASSPRDLPGG